jgi:hypothetical protein
MTSTLDRAALIRIADDFMDALGARKPQRLTLSSAVRYTENGVDLALDDGLWASCQGRDGDYKLFVADVARQEVAQFGRLHEAGDTALVATRLRIEGGIAISEIETIVARRGTSFLQHPDGPMTVRPAFGEALPAEARVSRADMLEAADGYFRGLEQATDQVTNFHADAHRIENGNLMTNNPDAENPVMRMTPKAQFATGFSRLISALRERRYLVDEETGVACAMLFFDHGRYAGGLRMADGSEQTPPPPFNRPFSFQTFECFKVWGGALREIEAILATCPYGMPSGWVRSGAIL